MAAGQRTQSTPGPAGVRAPTAARAEMSCTVWNQDDITSRAADQVREGGETMAKNSRVTGPRAASDAGRTLADPDATSDERSAAASALAQTPFRSRKGKK